MQTVLGKKPFVNQLSGVVINIGIDIWWFTSHGANIIFWMFIATTIVFLVQAVYVLSKNIQVERAYVKINNTEIPYSNIVNAHHKGGLFSKDSVVITTTDGKKQRITVQNAAEVAMAINVNKGV